MNTPRWTLAATLAGAAGLALAGRSWLRLAALRRQLADAHHTATHDPLTGLLNRGGLAQAWPMLAPARPAVALLDLDGFKPVNDRHGHAAGDTVLTVVADRLVDEVHGVVARLGGDEFAAVLLTTGNLARLAEAIAAPVTLAAGATVRVTASIGTAGSDDGDLVAALARADAAMYHAKATGTGVAAYDPHRDDRPAVEARPDVRVRDFAAIGSAAAVAGGVR